MPAQDYYETLGVSKTATADEIRKAHKRMSKKYHPDVNKDDKEAERKFKEVQTAYDVLSDDEKRKTYDQFGSAAFEQGGGVPGGPGGFRWAGPGGGGGQVDLESLFGAGGFDPSSLFGGGRGRGRSRVRKGEDVEIGVDIPFTVACQGGGHEVALDRGGKVERVSVKIPAGIDHGAVIRLAGQGEPGVGGGPAGDLRLTVRVASHPWFRREGANLLVDVPVTFTEAALGGKVDVPTLDEGRVVVTVPPSTSSGAKLRLREKGVVDRQTGKRGDLFAVLKVVPPGPLTDRARELLTELAVECPKDPRGDLWP
jgi:DnaJ-class molecular chaperone